MATDIKKRMLQAREAIKVKQYDKARKLLQGVDHPKAKEWLNRLDEVDPKRKAKPKAGTKQKLGTVEYIIIFLIVMVLLCMVSFLPSGTDSVSPAQLTATSFILTNDSISTEVVQTSEAREARNTTRNTSPVRSQSVAPQHASYTCNCSKTCGQMTCEEAYYQLRQCGCRERDGDSDGVPCESQCGR